MSVCAAVVVMTVCAGAMMSMSCWCCHEYVLVLS